MPMILKTGIKPNRCQPRIHQMWCFNLHIAFTVFSYWAGSRLHYQLHHRATALYSCESVSLSSSAHNTHVISVEGSELQLVTLRFDFTSVVISFTWFNIHFEHGAEKVHRFLLALHAGLQNYRGFDVLFEHAWRRTHPHPGPTTPQYEWMNRAQWEKNPKRSHKGMIHHKPATNGHIGNDIF